MEGWRISITTNVSHIVTSISGYGNYLIIITGTKPHSFPYIVDKLSVGDEMLLEQSKGEGGRRKTRWEASCWIHGTRH